MVRVELLLLNCQRSPDIGIGLPGRLSDEEATCSDDRGKGER
jgi:hypothetical protein